MKKKLISLVLAVLLLGGCDLFRRAARPAAAGVNLAACTETSKTPAEYTECCIAAAKRFPLRDGGARDTSDCHLDGGP